ncbi:MAG: hypothetical protein R2788_07555 [Saprospiraceae bacterium]
MKIKNLIVLFGLFILATSATFSAKTKKSETPVINAISKESFVEFLSYFEKKELPYGIGLENLEAYNGFKKNKTTATKNNNPSGRLSPISNSNFIPGSRFGKMSRMGPPELIPVARFYPNDKMVAVIYSSNLRFGSGLDKSYNMIVYDLKGNILQGASKDKNPSSFLVAQSSVEQSITFQIDKQGRIWKNTYDNIWEESLDNKWIDENLITGFEIKNTEVFELDKNGRLEQLKEIPTVAKASVN